jgi:hypothetical protein
MNGQERTGVPCLETIIDYDNIKPLNIKVFIFIVILLVLNRPSSPLILKGWDWDKRQMDPWNSVPGDIWMISARAQTLKKLIAT